MAIAAHRMALLRVYAALLRSVRPNAGLTRLSFNPPVNALFRGAEGTLTARLPGGVEIEVEPDEYHGRILWLTGSNDWKVSRAVDALLSPGDVLLDIGANYGSIGFSALRRVGPGGAVHLFDPQKDVADRVEAAIARAGLERVQLHRVALSDRDGEVVLAGPSRHRGMATILPPDELSRPRDRSETVEMRDTRPYVEALVAGRAFGVKIDVEGAEPMVLPGLVALPGLRFVVFEGATGARWLWDFFTGHGFAVFGLSRSPLVPRVERVRRFEAWDAFHDFVALPGAPDMPDRALPLAEFAKRAAS